MASLHNVGNRLILCASSKVIDAQISNNELCVNKTFDVREASDSLPLPLKGTVDGKQEESELKKPPIDDIQILCSAVSNCQSMLTVATSVKTVLVLDLSTLTVRRGFRIPKAPTSIIFDTDNLRVIVGDRAGHVCRYTVAATDKYGYVDINGEMSPYEGEALSGVISMVLDVAISNDGKFLLVADRDEKIRVSRYPETYVIQSFCLGHSAYVSSLALRGNRLFSGGGDGIIYEWELENGFSRAHSEKLGEDPIRRIYIWENDGSFLIAAIMGDTVVILDEHLKCVKTLKSSSLLMDITTLHGNIVAVSSVGVVLFNLSDENPCNVQVPCEVLETLSLSKDPILSYFKNITHQNMLDYYRRKVEKIESTKESRNRKRKAKQLRRAEEAKKTATENEMEAVS